MKDTDCSACLTLNACFYGFCSRVNNQLPHDDEDVPEIETPIITGKYAESGLEFGTEQTTSESGLGFVLPEKGGK